MILLADKGPFTYYVTQGGWKGLQIFVTKCDGVGGLFLDCDVTFFEQLETWHIWPQNSKSGLFYNKLGCASKNNLEILF